MKNLILTGWGWKDYACAAALALRKYPDSDVLGMSTRRLPEFLNEVNFIFKICDESLKTLYKNGIPKS